MNEEIKTVPLDTLQVGQEGTVQSMDLGGIMRRRLQDLGMIPGTVVVPTKKSPGKGPTAYRVRDTIYAVRQSDACHINVLIS